MSLFRSSVRPSAILSDEAIERYIASIRTQIDPDPLFRRRLRGIVVNRYVAAREGLVPARGVRSMGRLGRACLYASFVLGVSVTSVMAASESAVPGDLLYPLKRQMEHLRLEVIPAEYHDVLAAHALSERISELDVLVDRQDWERAAEIAPSVAHELETLAALDAVDAVALAPQLDVLEGLVARLPARAGAAIVHALEVSTAPREPAGSAPDQAGSGIVGGPANRPSGGASGAAAGDRPSPAQPGSGEGDAEGTGSTPSDPGEQGAAPDPSEKAKPSKDKKP